jgi:cytoskeletal protein CcmA (bactofilin family)
MAQAQPVLDSRPEQPRRSLLSLVQRSGGAVTTHVAAFLGPNVKVTGDVSFAGGLRIDGVVTGDVGCNGDQGGTLTIGNGGQVQGDIRVTNLVVYGHIQGNVHVSGLVDIREQALVVGDVHYAALDVAPGGVIQGRLVPQHQRA